MRIFFPVMLLIFLSYNKAESNTHTKLTEVMYIKMKPKILISKFPEFSLVYFVTSIPNYPFVLCAIYVLTGLSPIPGIPVSYVLSEHLMPPVTRTTASGQYQFLPILHCLCFPHMEFSYWLSWVSAWNFRKKMCKDPFDRSSEKQWCEMSICCTLDLRLFLNTL